MLDDNLTTLYRMARRPVIFWVEDNERDVLLVRTAFSEIGVDVELLVVDNAMSAFRYLESREPYSNAPRPPNLVIVDLNLPAIRGHAVLEEVRKHPLLGDVPAVVLTSTQDARELAKCRELGAVECIAKPPTFEGYREVALRLLRHLSDRPGSGSPSAPTKNEGPRDGGSSRCCSVQRTGDAPARSPRT